MGPASVCLQTLLAGLTHASDPNHELTFDLVSGLSCDSRQVQPGDLFLAIPGQQHHGLDFQENVISAGASAIAWEYDEQRRSLLNKENCQVVAIAQLSKKLGHIADRFYAYPSQDITLIGITGTDGKTSCAHFIAQILHQEQQPCGVLGTLGHGVCGHLQGHGLTTADAVTLRRWLAQVRAVNGRFAVMEVSSHALDQGRPEGLDFTVAVLTNLTRDHLDYHGNQQNYAAAKRPLFFDYQPRQVVLNLDDEFGQLWASQLWASQLDHCVAYGLYPNRPVLSGQRYVFAENLQLSSSGLTMQIVSSWGRGIIKSELLGRFNASNLLASLAVLLTLEMPFQDALSQIGQVAMAPGRMQRFGGQAGAPLAVVDYSHTPNSIEQALRALREHGHGKLWCVFGCGGDRDPGKRPLMGARVERWADELIVTNDNPRSEDPQVIVQHILSGMKTPQQAQIQLDRKQAIIQALNRAEADDIVLVAGKGHEDYQILGNHRLPFSDQKIIQQWLGAHD